MDGEDAKDNVACLALFHLSARYIYQI
jgi:hypothetical protein